MEPVLDSHNTDGREIDGDTDAAEILAARVPSRAWQRMLSGRRLDLLNPAPAEIELDDIAHGLARVARWNGQTQGPHVFSVAQHSLLVEAIAVELEPELDHAGRLAALLHDAPEYVIGDLITPLKGVIGDGYGRVEARLLAAVYRRFGLPGEPGLALRRLIKRADRVAACLEAMRLAGFSYAEADAVFGMPEIVPASADALLTPWPTDRAAEAFRERVTALFWPGGASTGDKVHPEGERLAQLDAS
jgi:5'-deoxynucleotidase YfbR-like HD superfamily hydrolase